MIQARSNIIGIACNTIHFLYDKLPRYDIKLLNIVDCTVHKAVSMNLSKVGLLATNQTINSNIYRIPLESENIKVVVPSDED